MVLIRERGYGRRRGGHGKSHAGRLSHSLGVECLEDRALLAAMTFAVDTEQMGLDPAKYSLYAMGSNFTTSASTNWYMDDTLTFKNGLPDDNRTRSYKVSDKSTITVGDEHIAGGRIYFFVVPVGAVASATVMDGSFGYQGATALVTFSPPPSGGVTAQGYAKLVAYSSTAGDNHLNKVESIVVTNPGSGYTSPPTVTIPAPGVVDSVTVTVGGSGYREGSSSFLITDQTTGSSASATVQVVGGAVQLGSATVGNRGTGYSGPSPFQQMIGISPGVGGEASVTLVEAATASSALFGAEGPSLPVGKEPANPPGYPFVYQFVEFTSIAGKSNTVDLQTVDGFTMPLTITAGDAFNTAGSQYGQPIGGQSAPANSAVTRTALFYEYETFMSKLGTAGQPYVDLPYQLEAGLVDGQLGGILSPDAFLSAQSSNGDYSNLGKPLDSVFDDQLTTLFSQATTGAGGQLSLQGVPSGSILEQVYTATYMESVPYPAPAGVTLLSGLGQPIEHPALQMVGTLGDTFNVFSPIGLTRLTDTSGHPLMGKITSVSPGSPQTATLSLDQALPDAVVTGWFVYGSGLTQGSGHNQSAAITPWYVSSMTPDRKTVSLSVYEGNGTISGSAGETTIASQYQFSKLPYISMMLTPGQMTFGNSGVFADNTLQYVAKSDEATVVANLEYQIAAALNRGVVFAKGAQGATNGGTSTTWFEESGWYPTGKTQNLFSYFMHVAAVKELPSGGQVPIFFQPENAVQINGSLGSATMGSAYGFPFDETPGTGYTQVPSKFDGNIGGNGGLPTTIYVTFGPWGTVTPVTDPTIQAPSSFTIYTETGPLDWTQAGKPLDVILNVPAEEVVLVTMTAEPTASIPAPKFTWGSAAGVSATLVTGDSVIYLQGAKAAIVAALGQATAPLGFNHSVIPPPNSPVNLTISGWRKPAASWTPFDTAFSVVDNVPLYPLVVDVPTTPQSAALDTPTTLDLPQEMFADTDPSAAIYHVAIFSVSASGSGTGQFNYASRPTGPSVTSWNTSGPMSGPSDGVPQSISFFGTIPQINQYVTTTGLQFKATREGDSKIDVTLLRLAVSSTTGGWIVVDSETNEMTITTGIG